jgi:hypothetical protein
MAPFVGPTRDHLLAMLREARSPRLPITLGRYAPQAVVDLVDGEWCLCPLEMDQAAADAAGRAAFAAGGSWMPEMTWRFLRPGAPLLRAPSRQALADLVADRPWPYG